MRVAVVEMSIYVVGSSAAAGEGKTGQGRHGGTAWCSTFCREDDVRRVCRRNG